MYKTGNAFHQRNNVELAGSWNGGYYVADDITGVIDGAEVLLWNPREGNVPSIGIAGQAVLYSANGWIFGGPCIDIPLASNRKMRLDALASLVNGDDLPVNLFAALIPRSGNGTVLAFTTNAAVPYHTFDFNGTVRPRTRRDSGAGVSSIASPDPNVILSARGLYTWIFEGTQSRWSQDELMLGPTAQNTGALAGINQVVLGNFFQAGNGVPFNGLIKAFGIRSAPFTQSDVSKLYNRFYSPKGNIWQMGSSLTVGSGSSNQSGWRKPLWTSIIQGGYRAEFVGTLTDPSFTFPHPKYDGSSGISQAAILTYINTVFGPGNPVGTPALVLIQSGIGNMASYNAVSFKTEHLAVLNRILELSPGTKIADANMPPQDPATRPAEAANIPLANAQLVGDIWPTFNAAHPDNPVIQVDMNTAVGGPGFVPANYSDDVHFNNTGYDLAAGSWYSSIQPFLASW